MSLLSVEEKEALKKKGLYVKEKCDRCGEPLLTPYKYIRKGQDICQQCRDKMVASGEWQYKSKVPKVEKSNQEEGRNMATKKQDEGAEKVGGLYRANSARAIMFQALEDEKVHDMKEITKIVGKETKSPRGLLMAVKRDGEAEKSWGIAINGDKVQLKMGKAGIAAAAAAKAPKPSPAQKTVAKQAPAPAKAGAKSAQPPTNKRLVAVASLVRKVLKTSGTWTKNKIVEKLKNDSGVDQKETLAAIARELSLKGIVEKKGTLALAAQ